MLSELDTYLQRIDDLRGQAMELIIDLPPEALSWRPLPEIEGLTTNSLAVLATHIAGAEHFWIGEVVGGGPPTRDRKAEFATQVTDSSELQSLLERTGLETHAVLSALRPASLEAEREVRGRTVSVRWGILHVIDHTALHLGHMQLTRQLWMGGQASPSPRWYERLSSGQSP
jgi:uncharacterized damage-inducible protein DinB